MSTITYEQIPPPPPTKKPEPTWWTYTKIENYDEQLRQGDILLPSPEMQKMFGEGHDFTSHNYLAFIIATQDCDLVLRGSKCDTDYISLAGVMSLQTMLPFLFDAVCTKVSQGVYTKGSKEQAKNLLTRILNQNAWKIGLFYLHNDPGAAIYEPAIALLRVCTSVKSTEQNYTILKKARKGRLSDLFRAKLGWTIGNLYSRVGTPDWGDVNKEDEEKMRKLIKKILDSEIYCWIPGSWVLSARKAGVEIEEISDSELLSTLEQYKPTPFYEEVIKRVKRLLTSSFPKLTPQELENFEKLLREDTFIQNIKSRTELKD